MSEEREPTRGATGEEHKTIPRKRVRNAYRRACRAGTEMSLKEWLQKQNGHIHNWAQVWFKNKLG